MSLAITWNDPGTRRFEAGLDRGVLYPEMGLGVPWNGLVSVNENVVGGEQEPYYYDGVKYFDFIANQDFQATLSAYTYPDEFDECDGIISLVPGVLATLQPRKNFGLCYRTQLGNDTQSLRYGYKLHLVYNATASPSIRANKTLSNQIEPNNFEWTIDTVPPAAATYKPTAHIVVDSRNVDRDKLDVFESFLYGHIPDDLVIDGGSPSFSTPDELDGGTPSLADFGDPSEVDGGNVWASSTIPPGLPPQADVVAFLS